jgi:hypothetical protein
MTEQSIQDALRAQREIDAKLRLVDNAHATMRTNLGVWLRNPNDEAVAGRIDDALATYARGVRAIYESHRKAITHG